MGLVANLNSQQLKEIQYHVKTCYATYKKKGERHGSLQSQKRISESSETSESSPLMSPPSRPKRSKTSPSRIQEIKRVLYVTSETSR